MKRSDLALAAVRAQAMPMLPWLRHGVRPPPRTSRLAVSPTVPAWVGLHDQVQGVGIVDYCLGICGYTLNCGIAG